MQLPGTPIELEGESWSPEEEDALKKKRAYKKDMAKPEADANPFSQFLQDATPATRVEEPKTGLWDRFKGHFQNSEDFGSIGLDEIGKIRDAQVMRDILPDGSGGVYQQTEADAQADAEFIAQQRAERKFQFESMDPAETPMDYLAAIGGSVVGSVADPTSLINPEIKVGTTAWRMGNPVLSKVLNYGVSGAAMNVALDATVQSEEEGVGLRKEMDWQAILLDAGAGFGFGAPFGYMAGRAAKAEMDKTARLKKAVDDFTSTQPPPPGTAPMALRNPRAEVPPTISTPETVSAGYSPEEIAAAQEKLFGEVVGTRNLTPEQLVTLEDNLNAGKPYGETTETVPEVQGELAPTQGEPLPQVRESGQPEGSQGARKADESPPLKGNYADFKPVDLKVDAKRFQYKGGADEEGVVETLKKVKTWDPNKAGTIIVWQDLKGNNYVVDGHQRYGLAKRLKDQDPTLHALVWKEADGVSAQDAKLMAADINISQGSGTAIDAAKILRDRPDMLQNLPKNAVTEHATGLAKLSDDAFGMVVNGKVPPEFAAVVGKIAPNPETHAQIMDVLAKNEPASAVQAESMVRDVLSAPEVEATMVDMFGSSETTQILFKERAQILSSAATLLRKDRAAFNTLVKEEARLTGAGNKLATKTNLERANTDAEILATLQATARRKGPVADALAAAAKALNEGTSRNIAVRDFLNNVRGPGKGASPDGEGLPPPAQSIAASLGGYRNTDSPAFQRWFGDSKVVDEDGEPLVVYHGTKRTAGKGIESFDTEQVEELGTHFGTKDQANLFVDDEAGEIYPSYLKIERPLRLQDWGDFSLNSVQPQLDDLKIPEPRDTNLMEGEYLRARISEAGYDGVVYLNRREGKQNPFEEVDGDTLNSMSDAEVQDMFPQAEDSYIAFSPTQIKSIYNRGTWDAADPRIAYNFLRGNQMVRDTVYGVTAVFPDEEHRRLYRLGADLLEGKNPEPAETDYIFRTFKDFVEGDAPLKTPDDAEDMAREFAESVRTEANKGKAFVVHDMMDTDEARVEWLQRQMPNVDLSKLPVSKQRQFAFSVKQSGPGLFDVGAEGKPQAVLPGAERIGDKRLAELRAKAPMRSGKSQKDMDFGLFSDTETNQLDLVDLSRVARMSREETDYLDFTPTGKLQNAQIGKASVTYAVRDGEVEIISFRVPVEERRRGQGREAMLAFLERADDDGLQVRAYSTPLDRSMDPEGIIRFYESVGFTPTGRKIDRAGNLEMLRAGPPPEVQELRSLVGNGRIIPLQDYTDPVMADSVRRAYYGAQPERTLDQLYGGVLQKRQAELVSAAEAISKETGAVFKNPGPKDRYGNPAEGIGGAEEKMVRKRYKSTKQLTDLVRGGFLVDTPDEAARTINLLARKFQILDEGWNVGPTGYFDKKISIRFVDGIIGEVQFWHPDLLKAKNEGGGHALYKKEVALPPGPEKAALQQAQRDLYEPVLAGLDPSWAATVGRSGNVPNERENVSRMSSSEASSRPESLTSEELTSSQSAPGSSTAQAAAVPLSTTAGRPSQSTKSMSPSISPQGIARSARPQPLSNMPVNRSQAGIPAPGQAQRAPKAERLENISESLRAVTGAPVRQGRLARAPKGQKVAGQYDRDQGVIRMREMADFDTQTHETAHSLETEWGRSLNTLKVQHKAELEALAYPGADPKQQLSEGFAEWFRHFVTNPLYARRQAPNFTDAFVNMLDTQAREQLDAIRDVSARYRQWEITPSGMAVAADIVSSRKGNMISEAVKEAGGPREALGEFMSMTYTSLIDKLHPINRAVDELMKVYEKRTGKALDIKTAQDPYRLARLLSNAYSAGHVDAMHGVVPYHGVVSEGASLSDAITTALGSSWRGWDDAAMADFAAYLVSRRALKEYDRYLAGEVPNPPGKYPRGDYEVARTELEAANPNYVQAADMVYEWGRNMLKKKYESGFITQELYEKLLKREDYVPFMRDLRDLDRVPGVTPNMTLRQAILKGYQGSKRSVINPLESMLADAYHFNALMKRNEVFRTLEDLARMAGPGGGAIVERIPSTQLKGTKVEVDEVLKQAAQDAGLSPDDVDQLTTLVDDLLGEDASATVFRSGEINEKGEPIIYAWRDGKKHALRLADGDFGRDLYNAMTGMNKESRNLFVSILSLPSTVVRYGVTTAPPFVLANYIRDQMSAWVLAGDGYIPFISGAMGLKDELTQAEVTRIYNSFGGIMGGGNVASLDKGRAKRDINALNKKGYHVKRFASIRGFAEFTGLTETGTRLGIFKNSFARAKRNGMTDYEAANEASFQAVDYIDFGRNGSQTHAARRLVTFLNASMQGLNKTVRVLTGEGSIRKAIAPFINRREARPLGSRDKANLAKAASAWAKVAAIGVFGLGLSYLYRDDPEYEEISDYLKATNWMVKKGNGEWYAIPKPFELGFISNLFERGFDSVYKRNPIAMQSFLSGLYEVTAPPMGIPLFETGYQLKYNKDAIGRDIVGQDIAGFEPWRQYTAQTSEIAKNLGAAVNVSPAKIDHAIQGFGASWGKIITDASVARAQGKSEVDILTSAAIGNRFVRDVTRGATSTRKFWNLMSESTGPMMQAANTYKDQFENAGELQANQMLAPKDENTKALALMMAHFPAEVERLNPMIRAKDAISVITKIKRELAGNELRPIDNEEVTIAIPASNRSAAQELLSTLTMIEARNALIVLGVPGWQQKELMETATLYEDLRSLSPELADEVEARMSKKKVYDFEAVRETWPEVKSRILTDRQDADFSDIVAGMGVQ